MAGKKPTGQGAKTEGAGFLRYYWTALRRLVDPPEPLIVTAVYCVVALVPSYHGNLFQGHLLGAPFKSLERAGLEGLWYVLMPAAVLCLVWVICRAFRRDQLCPRPFLDFGWRWGNRAGWRDALILYVLMLPVLLWAARRQEFAGTYPLADIGRRTLLLFLLWEAVHLVHMFGWEYLHRGFLLFGLERRMGRWAVLASAVPFALLHVNKPELEAYGSFIAGIALGWLALRSRSFLPAALLHWAVAATFDVIVILGTGGFG